MIPVAALIASIVLTGPAMATSGWTDPVRLPGLRVVNGPDGPAVTTHRGKIYIAVSGRRPGGTYLLTNRSGQWRRERVSTVTGSPSIAVDRTGHVHIAIGYLTPGEFREGPDRVRYITDRGGSWKTTSVARWGLLPTLALTRSGTPRVAYITGGGRDGPGTYLATLASGTWVKRRIAGIADMSLPRSQGPSIAIHGSRTFVAYHRQVSPTNSFIGLVELERNVVVRRSRVTTTTDVPVNVDLAVDGRGRPHVAFIEWSGDDDGGLWYARRTLGGPWIRRHVGRRVDVETRPSIAYVGDGHVAIITQRDNDPPSGVGNWEIVLFTNRTGGFVRTQLTERQNRQSPRDSWPQIVLVDRKLRVVFVRSDGDSAGVWLMRER
jgi:hypothetical protein